MISSIKIDGGPGTVKALAEPDGTYTFFHVSGIAGLDGRVVI
jgi:hypothetical protein